MFYLACILITHVDNQLFEQMKSGFRIELEIYEEIN